MRFSHVIYDSWKGKQNEKFETLFNKIDLDALGGLILDLGSGSGFLGEFLKTSGIDTLNFVELEIDKDMIRKSYGEKRILGDGNNPPFKDEMFDWVFCIDAVHMIECNLSCLVKPGGYIIISLFFNQENLQDKKEIIMRKIGDFEILEEFIHEGQENELFIFA
ncbi:MAG: hypothetical protein DRP15_01355, partial [Candidatus Aenigmatarchaeota archaeon]